MFILIVLIFTGSIKKTPDQSYLSFVIGYAIENFSGTIVTKGYGKALVIRTGMQSEIGKIARMMQTVKDESTPLQQRLKRLGQIIGVTAIIVSVMVFIGLAIIFGLKRKIKALKFINFNDGDM